MCKLNKICLIIHVADPLYKVHLCIKSTFAQSHGWSLYIGYIVYFKMVLYESLYIPVTNNFLYFDNIFVILFVYLLRSPLHLIST